jgi:uncharacterized caspase-like protein
MTIDLFGDAARHALRARYHSGGDYHSAGKVLAALRINQVERRAGNAKRWDQTKHTANTRGEIVRGVRLHAETDQRVGRKIADALDGRERRRL